MDPYKGVEMLYFTSNKLKRYLEKFNENIFEFFAHTQSKLICKQGQGTTEYAILVGVLVVIAILAIVIFKPKLQELWDAISDGINSL